MSAPAQLPVAPHILEQDLDPIDAPHPVDDEDPEMDSDDDEEESEEEEEQEVLPQPPSPAVSSISYESDVSDAYVHALTSDGTSDPHSTFEVGESSSAPRVSPSELRAELSRLRHDISWCQGRYTSMSRRLSERRTDVTELQRQAKRGRRHMEEFVWDLECWIERVRSTEESLIGLMTGISSLEKKLAGLERTVMELDMRADFTSMSGHRFFYDLQAVQDELHAMQWQMYWRRMEEFRPRDSIDVLATYEDASQ